MAWYDFAVSQSYNGSSEHGVDVATPLHTPITNIYAGKVVQAQYGGAGGIVGVLVNVPGLGSVIEYFLHLDSIDVKVGQQLNVGDRVGLSGGELAGTPGGMHPAAPQFSTGPHTEFGFFHGTPFASADAGNPIKYLHPGSSTSGGTPVPAATAATNTPAADITSGLCDVPFFGGLLCLGQNAGQAAGAAAAQSEPVKNAIAGITISFERIGFFVIALVLALVGVVLVAYQPAQESVKTGVKAAMTAAEVA